MFLDFVIRMTAFELFSGNAEISSNFVPMVSIFQRELYIFTFETIVVSLTPDTRAFMFRSVFSFGRLNAKFEEGRKLP
jgi:hypothetical protein